MTKKKIVYIAHPISGNVEFNLIHIKRIIRDINLYQPDIIPFAHYFVDCYVLDDDIPEERAKGIANDTELIKRGFIDECWLYSNRISDGMKAEIKLFKEMGIPVIAKTEGTKRDLEGSLEYNSSEFYPPQYDTYHEENNV